MQSKKRPKSKRLLAYLLRRLLKRQIKRHAATAATLLLGLAALFLCTLFGRYK